MVGFLSTSLLAETPSVTLSIESLDIQTTVNISREVADLQPLERPPASFCGKEGK